MDGGRTGGLSEEGQKRRGVRASGKSKQLIGATVVALVNYSDASAEHHKKREIGLGTRDKQLREWLDACTQV